MEEEVFKQALEAAMPEAQKRAKALAWARRVIQCLGEKKLESWFMANYIYFLNRGRPFGHIDYARVDIKDDELVLSLVTKIKPKHLKGEYLPYEHLLVLQDIKRVEIESFATDKEVEEKVLRTLAVIGKFPAKIGKNKAEWNWKVEPEVTKWLNEPVKKILERIQNIAKRKGCFQQMKKAVGG